MEKWIHGKNVFFFIFLNINLVLKSRQGESYIMLKAEDCHEIIIHLLNNSMKNFNLELHYPSLWSGRNDRLVKMMQRLSERAPNLEKLCIQTFYEETHASLFASVVKPMLRLQKLHLTDWKWTDNELNLLPSIVPNLNDLFVSSKLSF
jgi:hypothetical protein